MKLFAIIVFAAAAAVLAASAATQPAAASRHAGTPTTLRVVMHDPGCHWFAVGHTFTTRETVSGTVRIVNQDIATLEARSSASTTPIPVGHSVVLGHGRYVITMVGQAPDDNHLKLTVR